LAKDNDFQILVTLDKAKDRQQIENRENNDISSVKIMSLPLRAMVFYKPKSLPHFGKLIQTNEVVALLRMRRLFRRCG